MVLKNGAYPFKIAKIVQNRLKNGAFPFTLLATGRKEVAKPLSAEHFRSPVKSEAVGSQAFDSRKRSISVHCEPRTQCRDLKTEHFRSLSRSFRRYCM
jgi:hypothetical protein